MEGAVAVDVVCETRCDAYEDPYWALATAAACLAAICAVTWHQLGGAAGSPRRTCAWLLANDTKNNRPLAAALTVIYVVVAAISLVLHITCTNTAWPWVVLAIGGLLVVCFLYCGDAPGVCGYILHHVRHFNSCITCCLCIVTFLASFSVVTSGQKYDAPCARFVAQNNTHLASFVAPDDVKRIGPSFYATTNRNDPRSLSHSFLTGAAPLRQVANNSVVINYTSEGRRRL